VTDSVGPEARPPARRERERGCSKPAAAQEAARSQPGVSYPQPSGRVLLGSTPCLPALVAARPERLLSLQSVLGNHYVARIAAAVQRQTPPPPAESWASTVKRAETALQAGDKSAAISFYQRALAAAAGAAPPPQGVPALSPTAADIRIDVSLAHTAEMNLSEVAKDPRNYWRWIRFGPSAFTERTFTESTIAHELIHVRQTLRIWQEYASGPGKGSWEVFSKQYKRTPYVQGPTELEAEVSTLGYVRRLRPAGQSHALHLLFTAYTLTSTFKPAGKPETPPLAVEDAAKAILALFGQADKDLRDRMGRELWEVFLDMEASKEMLARVFATLGPVAKHGWQSQSPEQKRLLLRWLAMRGLTFGGAPRPAAASATPPLRSGQRAAGSGLARSPKPPKASQPTYSFRVLEDGDANTPGASYGTVRKDCTRRSNVVVMPPPAGQFVDPAG